MPEVRRLLGSVVRPTLRVFQHFFDLVQLEPIGFLILAFVHSVSLRLFGLFSDRRQVVLSELGYKFVSWASCWCQAGSLFIGLSPHLRFAGARLPLLLFRGSCQAQLSFLWGLHRTSFFLSRVLFIVSEQTRQSAISDLRRFLLYQLPPSTALSSRTSLSLVGTPLASFILLLQELPSLISQLLNVCVSVLKLRVYQTLPNSTVWIPIFDGVAPMQRRAGGQSQGTRESAVRGLQRVLAKRLPNCGLSPAELGL